MLKYLISHSFLDLGNLFIQCLKDSNALRKIVTQGGVFNWMQENIFIFT